MINRILFSANFSETAGFYLIEMIRDFEFRVQKVLIGDAHRFQLRVGMSGERAIEYIPVHRTAFATRLPLKDNHNTEAEAVQERDALVEWLRSTLHN